MRWHDQIVWRNSWILGDAWGTVSKAFKIFIIIGIGGGRSKDNVTKNIMIGLVLHDLMVSLMGMGSCIWMNMEGHGWIWIKHKFWIG